MALDGFFERSAMLRYSPEIKTLPLVARFLKRLVLGAGGSLALVLGKNAIVAFDNLLGQGFGIHLLTIGFLFLADQWLNFNADFHRYHVTDTRID